jgi:5-formyltetrahydrofolate cyclo-ligase
MPGDFTKRNKLAIRQDMIRRRDAMGLDDVLNFSQIIEDKLFACKEFSVRRNIMFYLSFGNEVRTDEMIARSLQEGRRVYVPRLTPRERRLEVCEIKDMGQEFELSSYGIREPSGDNFRVVSPLKVDAIISPGLAFDFSGRRVGYGGGYFDWLLNQLPEGVLRLAVAYGFQVVDSVPQDSWDERVQKIFTENDTINC